MPIEREMNGIPKENNLRSVSLYALSSIDITFDQDTDRNFARQQVFNRLGGHQPADRRRAVGRAADLAVGADLPLHAAEPRPLADRAQDVRGLDGRAAIQVGSRRCRRFRLRRRHDAVSGAARPVPARRRGPLRRSRSKARSPPTTATAAADSTRRAGNSITSAALGRIETLEDIGNVVVAVHNGIPTLVKDVGQVDARDCAAPRPIRDRQAERRRRRRDHAAHRRQDAGRAEAASKPRRRSSTPTSCPRT